MTLSNPSVVSFFAEKVVPVWQSLGAVPKVTIELGDGTVVHRTIGGNIVTYLTTSEGRVIDALPGVYTADAYLSELQVALQHVSDSPESLRKWHAGMAFKAMTPSSRDITLSKAVVEGPLLKAMKMRFPESLDGGMHDLSKNPASADQLVRQMGIPASDAQTQGSAAVALDSQRNLEVVRPAIHELLAQYATPPYPDQIRDTIYKQILHVPIDEPDLGLRRILVPGSD